MTSINPLFTAEVVYQLPFPGSVRTDIPCGNDSQLLMDIYLPEQHDTPVPAVIFVNGYPDQGFKSFTGVGIRDIQQYRSWAKLLTAHGLAAIVYGGANPSTDPALLMAHLRSHGNKLGIDAKRLGVWSCSGNVPNALTLLQQDLGSRCAVLCYGFMLDLNGSTVVAKAASSFRFANTASATRFLPAELPVLVMRAGQDRFPGVNASIDMFVAEALHRNHPLSLVNYAQGVHAFDVLDTSEEAKSVVKLQLQFLAGHLSH